MRNRYHGLLWVVALVFAALLSSCQGTQSPPVSQANVTTPPLPTQAIVPATALPTTPPAATAVPPTTAEPTRPASQYDTLEIPAPALRDNQIGESEQSEIRVYLPPSYFRSDTRYPVVYYLPGYTDTSMLGFSLPGDADKLMRSGAIREMIIVVRSLGRLYRQRRRRLCRYTLSQRGAGQRPRDQRPFHGRFWRAQHLHAPSRGFQRRL